MLYTSLILGLVSSLHCVGMCGPIALSLGLSKEENINLYLKNLTYQFGRVTTYTFFGLMVGFFGSGIQLILPQQLISIMVGVIMLVLIVLPKVLDLTSFNNPLSHLLLKIKLSLGKLLGNKKYNSLYTIGILNGFLPCGPVYVALTAAIASTNVLESVLFMFFYGIGTIPLMFITVLFGNKLSSNFRNTIFNIYPYILVILAILFILRGLELNIPYVSPPKETLQIAPSKKCH